jgi:hypothetical protein
MVSNPLTLVMEIKSPEDFATLSATLEKLQSQPGGVNPISQALTKLGIVHFARFVFFGTTQLAVITEYDGDFGDYVRAFVNEIGSVFDMLLPFVKDAPPTPVAENAEAFTKFVDARNVKCASFYSAYPDLKVLDILAAQRNAGG